MKDAYKHFNKNYTIRVFEKAISVIFNQIYSDNRWVTTCTVRVIGEKNRVYSGSAICHPRDYNNQMTGLKMAYRRAVAPIAHDLVIERGAPFTLAHAYKWLRRARYFEMEGKEREVSMAQRVAVLVEAVF